MGSDDRSLIPREQQPAHGGEPMMTALARPTVAASSGESEHTPIHRIHALLRGRYHWAFLLALIGGLGGGFAAMQLHEPEYRSEGILHFQQVIPRVLYSTEDTGLMQRFGDYMNSQAAFLTNRRTVARAMESPIWEPYRGSMTPQEIQDFQDNINVRVRGELMHVTFEDHDPARAQAAVEATIEAYLDLYGDGQAGEDGERIQILEERRASLNARMRTLRDRIANITGEFGSPEALRRVYNHKLQEMTRLETRWRGIQLDLAARTSAREMVMERRGGEQIDPDDFSIEEIAQFDQRVAELLQRRRNVQEHLDLVQMRFGSGHREARNLQADMEIIERQLASRVREFQQNFDPEQLELASGQAQGESGDQLQRMHIQERQIRAMFEQAREEARALGDRHQQLQRIMRDLNRERERLEQTAARLEQLDVESAVRGRITTLSEGSLPSSPHNTGSKRQLAVLGGGGGAGVGVGLILLIGLFDRRFRSAYDAEMNLGQVPLLGLLPQMPDDLAEPEHAAMAAHGVHHIRTLLQVGSPERAGRVFTITSPASGSGKTSLTIALGLSFASSGARTLLVDADFHGAGLTSRMDAITRRRIGQVLIRQELIDQQQLDHALAEAQRRGQRLGDILVESGHLTREQLDQALSFQEHSRLGLLDAMEGESLEHCVAQSGVENLFVLPMGAAQPHDANRLSPATLGRLVDTLRDQFDTVLIDTGPVPGGIESAMTSAVADRLILAISKGEQRDSAEKAIQHLHALGASIAGLVFNRAGEGDYRTSRFSALSSSSHSSSDSAGRGSKVPVASSRKMRLGPLAAAVANGHADEKYTNGQPGEHSRDGDSANTGSKGPQ